MHPRLRPLLIFAAFGAGIVLAMNAIAYFLIMPVPAPAGTTITSSPATASTTVPKPIVAPKPRQYIEITESCGPYFDGACVNARSGPSLAAPSVLKLRTGIVLRVNGTVEADGHTWYKVIFDEWLRYPARAKDVYVAADYVREFLDIGPQDLKKGSVSTSTKRIVVDRSDQELTAYEGDTVFMRVRISTGLDLTPTPRGTFTVFRKTPSRYMQGPIPGISDQEYDLPGVPWNLYFTEQGGAIHGAYWHDHFGEPWSHGCVNLPLDKAKELYAWADLGTKVLVRD